MKALELSSFRRRFVGISGNADAINKSDGRRKLIPKLAGRFRISEPDNKEQFRGETHSLISFLLALALTDYTINFAHDSHLLVEF